MKRFPLVMAAAPLLLLGLALGACSDKSGTPAPSPTAGAEATLTPIAGTPEPLPASLRQVLNDVATVRHLTPPPDLKAELVARSDLPALLDRLLTDDDRRWFATTTTLYRLLGHLRKDQDYQTVWESFGSGSVLGLYSPVDKQLWVVHDDGAAIDFDHLPQQEKETLAHELVHAVQDYHFHLDTVYQAVVDDLDRNLTWTAVVEGDAVTHEALYGQRFSAIPFPSGRAFLLANLPQTQTVPPSIQREVYFPYTTGADWIRAIVQKTGTGKVDQMLADPPHGTAYVLHPELLDNGFQPATVTLPDLSTALGAGWKKESASTWGEFGIQNYLRLQLRAPDAGTGAAGWTGDHYAVYVNGSESVAAFRVKFRDASEAKQFADAQQSLLKAEKAAFTTAGSISLAQTAEGNVTATAALTGDEVIFTIGSTRESALRAMQALVNG